VPTTRLTPNAKQQFFDANGNPLAGGKLYTYAGGTTTLLATYTDSTGTTSNANPIILDSRGEANVWLTPGTSYKFKLTDANDVQIWVVDEVSAPASGVSSLSVVSANGFAGTVANPTTTPAITISTTVTGLLKGDGTAISAASSTDYQSPITLTTTGTSGAATFVSNTLNIPQYGIVSGTVQTAPFAAPNTYVDFTDIPSSVKNIIVMFKGVRTSGTSNPLIQIGAGSITTSGYLSCGGDLLATPTGTLYTSGFGISGNTATNTYQGQIILATLGSNAWTCSYVLVTSNTTQVYFGAGSITLGGALDRVRVTTVGGSNTFAAGSINIL
jgi:hypothetical protein